jgi:hypothetical protein
MTQGLIISVFKNPSYAECSNGGISSKYDQALVVGPDIPKIFDAGGLPMVRLVAGNLPGTAKVIPLEINPNACGPMFGGAYVGCSDSRWCDAIEKICGNRFYGAVSLHDRFE